MSSILVNDIFEELKEENKRLLNELLFSKKCLKILIEFETQFNSHSKKFKQCLESNEWQKFEKLNEEINKTLFKNDVNNDDTIDENFITGKVFSIKREPNSVIDENSGEEFNPENANKSNRNEITLTKRTINCDYSNRQKKNINKIKDEIPTQNAIKHKGHNKCNLCDNNYAHFSGLYDHKKTKHGIDGPINRKECPHCLKMVWKGIRFKVHMKMHENNGQLKCWHNGCDKVFDNEDKAVNHLNKHNLKEDPERRFKYGCDWPGCDYRAPYADSINRHKRVHQSDDISRMFVCHLPQCDKKFKRKRNLDLHLRKHMTDKRVECDICGKSYKNDLSLYSHKRLQHLRKKHLLCDHMGCQYRTNSLAHFKLHKIIHSTDTPFACYVEGCDKRFPSLNKLKTHNNSHLTECKYKCTFDGCEKTYRTESAMKIHYKRQHTDREWLRCDWPGCEYKTKVKSRLSVHSSVHKTERDFICEWPECGKGYKNKRNLKEHKKTHTKDKRYVCEWPECQYRTEFSSNLSLHRRKVHKKQ